MSDYRKFYIDGAWVDPAVPDDYEVINPDDESVAAVISLGTAEDIDRAVQAASRAFESYGQTPHEERLRLLENLLAIYERRIEEVAKAISLEMGAPISMARAAQAEAGRGDMQATVDALKTFRFEQPIGPSGDVLVHEPIGVCGLITPWNWPMNQITLKVAPALGVGCTVVLKPSEIAPLSAMLFAEMVDEAGYPAGVFNLVNGEGPVVGPALSSHPLVDMMSFTGSTRAGISVAKNAADTVKRVSQELGGKSPNIVFEDADLERAVKRGVRHCFNNTGQSCNAPTRMLVQRSVYDKVLEVVQATAEATAVGRSGEEGGHIGPLVSAVQFDKVQRLIETAVKEGNRLLVGGPGKPQGFEKGYFVKPTVFADVDNADTIAREEVFGPVLAVIPFETEEEAIRLANDTPYGLAAYLSTEDKARANRVARRLRAGMVHVNGTSQDWGTPFGGYKQSGNGRENGAFGLREFLEVKAISGTQAA